MGIRIGQSNKCSYFVKIALKNCAKAYNRSCIFLMFFFKSLNPDPTSTQQLVLYKLFIRIILTKCKVLYICQYNINNLLE